MTVLVKVYVVVIRCGTDHCASLTHLHFCVLLLLCYCHTCIGLNTVNFFTGDSKVVSSTKEGFFALHVSNNYLYIYTTRSMCNEHMLIAVAHGISAHCYYTALACLIQHN
jgi:hypothetical protein